MLTEKERKASATFGGDRFPMPDREHAHLALELLPKAKNITSGEKQEVRTRALRMLAAKKAMA
jgi:hypothetical protein